MMSVLDTIPLPIHWESRRFGRLVWRSKEANRSELQPLSVFLDEGVVPRASRSDNHNRLGEDMSKYLVVRPNDIVFNKLRTWQGGFGASRHEGIVSPAYFVCRPQESIDPRFIDYLLHSHPYLSELTRISKFMPPSQFDILWDDLKEMPIFLPSRSVQWAIADYLDTETSRIDALISKKQRMIELLQEGWFSSVESRMRELALEFGTIPLRYVVKCLDGARVPLSSEERGSREGPIPYYGASRIVDWIDTYIFDETLVLLGEDGAQLGDPRYEIAQVVSGKIWVNNHAHVLRPISVDPNFLTLLLNTFDRIPFISGGTREKITQDDMNRIPVPNLSPDEQKREVQRSEARRRRCVDATGRLWRQITLLQERRQILITAAVIGQLDIPEAAA